MNLYVSVADANTYFITRPNRKNWFDQNEDTKTALLIRAGDCLRFLNWAGDKTDSLQELEFPRDGKTTIPQAIKDAVCEIAYALLDGRDIDYDAETANVIQTTNSLRIDASLIEESTLHGIPSTIAWNLLKSFLRDGNSITLSRIT